MATPSHAALRKVTLNAARSKAFPDGSIRHGYDFVAPLTADGHIDLEAWKQHRGECFAHHAGGRGGSTWTFEWKGGTKDEQEEEGFRFGDHPFKVGEYVSVREEDGELLTFRVVSVGQP